MLKLIQTLILAYLTQVVLCQKLCDKKYFVVQHENPLDPATFDKIKQSSNFSTYSLSYNYENFKCYIPEIDDTQLLVDNISSDASTLKQEKDQAIDIIRNFNYAYRNTSTVTEAGYWKYVLNFDYSILQVHSEHSENGSIMVMDQYLLASWANNDTNSLDAFSFFLEKSTSDPYLMTSDFELITLDDGTKSVTQRVGNGEICDLTGRPRSTIINYKCNENNKHPILTNIHEWRTCQYLMDLESNFFCNYSMWTPPQSAVNNDINCYPMMEDFAAVMESDMVSENRNYVSNAVGPFHERLNIKNMKLNPLGIGLFFATHGNSYKFDILLTKDYNLWRDDSGNSFRKLLYDITAGIQKSMKHMKLTVRASDGLLRVLTFKTEFKIAFDVYDKDLAFAGTVQIENDLNGALVSKFDMINIPDNTNCLECN